MTANYVLLERITVGEAGAASVTFKNIPSSGYTDLKVVVSARMSGSNGSCGITFNGITSGYSSRYLYGSGSSAASGNSSGSYIDSGVYNWSASTANTFANAEFYIPNYLSNNAKSVSLDTVAENNATEAYAWMEAGLWSYSGQPAINQVSLAPQGSGNFVQYSTFSLYGLAAVGTTPVIAPYASGGDIIETDGTYWYHAFLSSGTFTPAKALSCDILQVAGGGGGAVFYGGGGGAGGVLGYASQPVTANTGVTVTIGAGGAGKAGSGAGNGTQGGNTQFGSLTASIGGGYGSSGSAGGSGGNGGGAGSQSAYSGGTGSQGYNGGNSNGSNGTGGGAGAGGNGGSGASGVGGNGGAGVNTVTNFGSLSTALSTLGLGVSGYIAGGGGANSSTNGTGGSGGGGNAGNPSTAGTPNTGSGGGGAGSDASKGGSGLVIVRYAI
jgi:hypothetical protein